MGNGLFGVLRSRWRSKQFIERRDVTCRRRDLDTIVERGKIRRRCSAARTAEGADSRTIHILACHEVVDAPHRVVHHIAGDVVADQHWSDVGFTVLSGWISNK